ncbi:uncharacterized protein Z519_03604 [Cladophialophora bantiana CBS 173.52]|uniref:EGF domain-specific O-linked N-acetylglucosamine transferase n=1 Tax=Cladophialophora bantiana (strain ATCC 10958 / CBS 173.52 / CDC B-1940 / NIH 8579) TaxID=1442370 RepID=A0A0D2HFM2_CLAB1|nr:uncharacterized protein Z519_07010 [Cladophialophora bantiana CBS 173.52]XP_016621692.1 uncharacterized protein Z519_03604 [Cladophialophora bantiana CBS 173.52]KIW92028.1 hypothetical protein Z519_07010 [Cladophialophora bantiana CBS 173.52]KIW95023.1 hypothetical protein Z519_03604 [Cladophialophora bantiana CBS 173.52]
MLVNVRLQPYRLVVFLGVFILVTIALYGLSGRSWLISPAGAEYDRTAGLSGAVSHDGSNTELLEADQFAWPFEYSTVSNQSLFCEERFGLGYLDNFSQRSAEYCTAESASRMTCFSSITETKTRRKDAFCIAGPATFDLDQHKFVLDCSLRDLLPDELNSGLPRFINLPGYWYSTGPKYIFSTAVSFATMQGATPSSTIQASPVTIVLKREDEYKNIWHALLEIFATFMTLDILRMAHNPATKAPFIQPSDFSNTQVLLLDHLPDGPYSELWHLFAQKPILRLSDITSSFPLEPGNIIVPLAGGGNPFWQGDWNLLDCTDSPLLRAFSRRVLSYYQIHDPPKQPDDPLVITYIDRTTKRRLVDQARLLDALRLRHPTIQLNVVDFAQLPFAQQLAVDRSTDILVGVHGAGLTHGMFLPRGSALVEILPFGLKHKGFLNMAAMLGHAHFSAESVDDRTQTSARGDWQADDVYIPQGAFLELVEQAIRKKMES